VASLRAAFRTLFHRGPLAAFLIDREGRLLEGSLTANALLGVAPGELPALRLDDLVADADPPWPVWMRRLSSHGHAEGRLRLCPPQDVALPCQAVVTALSEGCLRLECRPDRAAAAPEPSHLAMRSALDGLPAHICVLNARGTIVFVNRAWRDFARANGGDPDRVGVGTNYLAMCGSIDDSGFAQGLREVLGGRRRYSELEYPCHSPTEQRWFVVGASHIEGGGDWRVVVAHQPVTERKRAQTRLLEAQKLEALGTLASGLAHDFNNVLGAILGNASLVTDGLAPDSAEWQRIEQIRRAGLRARGLVQQILAFSLSQPRRARTQPLAPLIDEALSMLRPSAPSGAQLVAQVQPAPVLVDTDAAEIHQLLVNLGSNAWHALQGRPGRVTVGLETRQADAAQASKLGLPRPGAWAHLWVADDGCGMDDATRERIFEPFFTTRPAGQGTGLGLAVVHGIAARHGGVVTVDTAPGRGSSFHVWLPPSATPLPAPAPAAAAPAVRGRRERLLLLDDDEVVGLTLEALLDRAGFSVRRFSEPERALAALQDDRHAFDLVLTDYSMPVMSGMEVARSVAALRPDLPVMIVSGFISDDLRREALAAGVRALAHKENAFEELAGAVAEVLASSGA
jgi:signal transduction histidine kinase